MSCVSLVVPFDGPEPYIKHSVMKIVVVYWLKTPKVAQ